MHDALWFIDFDPTVEPMYIHDYLLTQFFFRNYVISDPTIGQKLDAPEAASRSSTA